MQPSGSVKSKSADNRTASEEWREGRASITDLSFRKRFALHQWIPKVAALRLLRFGMAEVGPAFLG
jgi:hypothetical protein